MGRWFGRIQRRVAIAMLLTALIPLVATIAIGQMVIQRISAVAFHPEFGEAMDRAQLVYADLVKTIKSDMRYQADSIAKTPSLSQAVKSGDERALREELTRIAGLHESLTSLAVIGPAGDTVGDWERAAPVDPEKERALTVQKALVGDEAYRLEATFATDAARFTEREWLAEFVQAYKQVERHNRTAYLEDTYTRAFSVLVGVTILLSLLLGVLVARPVTRRIEKLSSAMVPVAYGDLSVRVPEEGNDEAADLGRAFNRMLRQLQATQARVAFLRRVGEWQQMARRLAHEIKNPLTPIQLAVEECHQRYAGDDVAYRRIVDTTLEVVQEEVASLRRLVSEFSSFARLPQAELRSADLASFLRDQAAATSATSRSLALPALSEGDAEHVVETSGARSVDVDFEVPDDPIMAKFDSEMLHRALGNLVRNAAQAIRDGVAKGHECAGTIRVSVGIEDAEVVIAIDDDGPGVPPEDRAAIFDPYVTKKRDGTGLGLTIVKKIIVDHGGVIDVRDSELGGARFELRIPLLGSVGAEATDAAA